METNKRLRVGLSKQKRIYEQSKELLNKAGYQFDDIERADEVFDKNGENIAYFEMKGFGTISEYLTRGDLDVMFVGLDIVAELQERMGRTIPSILDTGKSKARFSPLALPQEGQFDASLYKKIGSKYQKLAESWLNRARDMGIDFANDLFVKEIESDADKMAKRYPDMLAMDIYQTGETAKALGLINLADEEVLPDGIKTSLQLFAREDLPGKFQEQAEEMKDRLEMVLNAEKFVLVKYNISLVDLDKALKTTSKRCNPTINTSGDYANVEVLVLKDEEARTMRALSKKGAKSIIAQSLNMVTDDN